MSRFHAVSAALAAVFLSLPFAIAPLAAEPGIREYASFLTADEQRVLLEKGELTNFGSKVSDLSLWSRAPFAAEVSEAVGGLSTSIAAEGLFIIDRPAETSATLGSAQGQTPGASTSQGQTPGSAQPAPGSSDIEKRILKSFTSFSTMKGLLAYSESKKKMETFIFDSYRIASLQDKAALPDPDIGDVPKQSSWTIYQKEEQAGDMYSRMTVSFIDGRADVTLTNLNDLKAFGIRLVRPEQLKTVFVVVPLGDKIALYGLTVANTPRFFGLERIKEKSFFNRMKALASWFQGNLAKS